MRKTSSIDQVNWLVATGQMWKMYLALLGFGGGLACLVVSGFLLVKGAETFMVVGIMGVLLGVATFCGMVIGLRCHHCQVKLVWVMLKKSSHLSWLVDLASLEDCPCCHARLVPSPTKLKRVK